MSKRIIGWVIIITAIILSFFISQRDMLLNGQQLDTNGLIMTVSIAGGAVVVFAIVTSIRKKKDDK